MTYASLVYLFLFYLLGVLHPEVIYKDSKIQNVFHSQPYPGIYYLLNVILYSGKYMQLHKFKM